MKLAYSIFAHSARISSDGLFDLSGGGLDHVTSSTFPLVLPHLAWVLRLSIEPEEAQARNDFLARVDGPDGRRLSAELRAELHPERIASGRPRFYTAHCLCDRITFEIPGSYRFQMYEGGDLIGESQLEAECGPVKRPENVAMRQAMEALKLLPLRPTSGTDSLRILREARAGGMYQRHFPS